MTETEAVFLRHLPCDTCGSSDANAMYSDGHQFCFACDAFVPGDGEEPTKSKRRSPVADLIQGEPFATTIRGIRPETFQHWRYTRGEHKGKSVHLATHYVEGRPVGQKVRFKGKDFTVLGKMDDLYGRWLWSKGGKRVVVTEGELDALSVSQVQGNRWPVVSVPTGAQGATRAFKKCLDWLESFEEVVIMFDMDEPGQEAATDCAQLLSPGKAKIAKLPLKDANDMLKSGEDKALISAVWNAEPYSPEGIVQVGDILEDVLKPIEWGRPWAFPELTRLTYGRRDGETYYLGAGTGVGKTDVLTEWVMFDLLDLGLNVGVLFLEQDPRETVLRLAGKMSGHKLHVPDAGWTREDQRTAVESLNEKGLYMFSNFGSIDWDVIRLKIREMVLFHECKHIYLDHLTALATHAVDERKALEEITAEIAMMAKELGICIHVVSHLATPEGKPHEEGGRVMIRHFKGSRAIGFWAHFMFGLERNQQEEDETLRHRTTFRVLKDRYTGQATGQTFFLKYDHETGQLKETDDDGLPSDADAEEIF